MKKNIKIIIFLWALLNCSMLGQAQEMLLDSYGKPLIVQPHTSDLKGNPYYFEDWKEGILYTTQGKAFTGVKLKLDLINNDLFYQEKQTNRIFILNLDVDSLSFIEPNGRKISFVKLDDGHYYQRLVKGLDYQLFKKINKSIIENQAYGSTEKSKVVLEQIQYYAEIDNKLQRIRPKNSSIYKILPQSIRKKTQDYIKDRSLNVSNENDLIDVFEYLNAPTKSK